MTPYTVSVAAKALRAIQDSAQHWSPAETGGVLLGYRMDGSLHVLEAVLAGTGAERAAAGCVLDSVEILMAAKRLAAAHEPALDLLGVWHSHPGDDPIASTADCETLRAVTQLNGRPMLSLIVSRDEPGIAGLWCMFHPDVEPVRAIDVAGATEWMVEGCSHAR